MTVRKYRRKPIETEIEAMQVGIGSRFSDMQEFCPSLRRVGTGDAVIPTPEGGLYVTPGDYIVKRATGEFFPCKPEKFHQTYEQIWNEYGE